VLIPTSAWEAGRTNRPLPERVWRRRCRGGERTRVRWQLGYSLWIYQDVSL